MVVVVVAEYAQVEQVYIWGNVSDGAGYGWDLWCGTPMNSMLGRIWKGEEAVCKNNRSVSTLNTVNRLDIYTREVEYHIHVSLMRSCVEHSVMVSSRGAGWEHSSCEISVDFPWC